MDNLARKIARTKWDTEPKRYLGRDGISADAVTGCLRTSGDSLSWWRCSDAESDVAEVVLALASTMEKFETIVVVLMPEDEFHKAGLEMRETEGDTPVRDLRSRHVDVFDLDLGRLGTVAKMLAPRIRSTTLVFTFTKKRVRNLVLQAIANDRVSVCELKEKLRKKLPPS